MRRRLLLAAPALLLARPSLAQGAWPQRQIRLVIGWPPGGGVDVFGRILQPVLAERLGQPVVIENIGGASGRLGSLAAARAAPDGYTLLLANDTFAATEALPAPGTQPISGALEPVTQAIEAPNALLTHPGSGIADVAGFATAARARPGTLNVGIPGWGSAHHLTSELLLRAAGGLQVEHVSYRGGGPLLIDLVAGKIDGGVVTLAAGAEHVRDGRLRLLAVTTRRREPSFPDAPSLAESIAPDFHLVTWQGIFAPAGTPIEIQRRVHGAVAEVLREARVAQRLAPLGFAPASQPPQVFKGLVDGTIERFAEVVRAAGIRADGA